MSEPLRTAVVGCGGIAQMMHLPTLTERPDLFTVTALCDVDDKTLAAVGDRYGVRARASTLDEVLAQDDVEAVLLCSPDAHGEPVARALAAGKHVFAEKPLGFSLRETEVAAAAAEASDRVLFVGTHKRYDPAFRRARALVRENEGVTFAGVRVLHPDDGAYRTHHAILPVREYRPSTGADVRAGMLAATRDGLREQVDELVGVDAPDERRVAALVLFQSLIHDANLIRGALGEPDEVLHASVWNGGLSQTSLTRFGDARVELTWLFLDGVRNYEEEVRFFAPDLRVTLTFPSPYLKHAPTPLAVERARGQELVTEHHTVSHDEAFREELHAFRAAVRDGAPVETDAADALSDARWLAAIAQAWSRG